MLECSSTVEGGGDGKSMPVQEAGEKRQEAGGRIPKEAEARRNRKHFAPLCKILFCNKKSTQRMKPLRKGNRTRSKRHRKQKAHTYMHSLFIPPPPPTHSTGNLLKVSYKLEVSECTVI